MDAKSTEGVNLRQKGMDIWPTLELVQSLLEGQLAAVACLQPAVPALSAACDAMAERLGRGGRLFYAGAGASGRLAIQDGIELLPTYSWPAEKVIYLLAGGQAALTASVEGAEDDDAAGRAELEAHGPGAEDVLIAVAASGSTPYTLGAARAMGEAGGLVIAIASNAGSALLSLADHPILTATGQEPVGGSTRMKAGTAQKIALNILSTGAMVRLGRVYDGYMIDVVASNAKLEKRSIAILSDLTGLGHEAAARLLEQAGGSIKRAMVMEKGLSRAEAEQALSENGGNLRRALAQAGGAS